MKRPAPSSPARLRASSARKAPGGKPSAPVARTAADRRVLLTRRTGGALALAAALHAGLAAALYLGMRFAPALPEPDHAVASVIMVELAAEPDPDPAAPPDPEPPLIEAGPVPAEIAEPAPDPVVSDPLVPAVTAPPALPAILSGPAPGEDEIQRPGAVRSAVRSVLCARQTEPWRPDPACAQAAAVDYAAYVDEDRAEALFSDEGARRALELGVATGGYGGGGWAGALPGVMAAPDSRHGSVYGTLHGQRDSLPPKHADPAFRD